jgi:23S rRNA (pseudouridine1915-N3)-methyltransferase
MYIQVVSVGKLSDNFQQIARNYKKMIRWSVKDFEISCPKKLPAGQIKQFEATLISKYLIPKSYKVALDQSGKCLTSHEFSELFNSNLIPNKDIEFIIGGAFGLDYSILSQVNMKLSLSKMTLPHQMAKIFLLEQIYRSQTILGNHPYHK